MNAARLGGLVAYLMIYLIILAKAILSCKVPPRSRRLLQEDASPPPCLGGRRCSRQLLMIRQQHINPRTCPAWWKFRLFASCASSCASISSSTLR